MDMTALEGATDGIASALARMRAAYLIGQEPALDQYAWDKAAELSRGDTPFTSLIAAALVRADTTNAALIRACWPELADATQRAYDTGSPSGERPRP